MIKITKLYRRFNLKPTILPCGHKETGRTNVDGQTIRVRKGDIGLCIDCGQWWECFGKSSERIRYIPSKADWDRLKAMLEKIHDETKTE